MKTNYVFRMFLMALMVAVVSSCRKEKDTDILVSNSEDDAEVSALFNEVDDEVGGISTLKSMEAGLSGYDSSGSKVVTIDSSGNQTIITVTYNNYCNGRNLRIKNGKIIITIEGRYADVASAYRKEVTFQNFTINGNLIEGTRVIAKDSANPYVYHITLQNSKITFTDGTSCTRTVETRTRTWTGGYNTPNFLWDDTYTIEGTASGVNRQGKSYTHTITTPLQISLDCPWIKAGVIRFEVTDDKVTREATLDYGTGACDNIGTVTIEGKTYTIRLRGGK